MKRQHANQSIGFGRGLSGLSLIALTVLMNVGCAEEKTTQVGAEAPAAVSPIGTPDDICQRQQCDASGLPLPPSGNEGSGSDQESGATADLVNVDREALNQMFFLSRPNNPTNIKINLNVDRKRESVMISYMDGGKEVRAALGVTFPGAGGTRVNERYNGWVNQGGTSVYKGFFQDMWGAVIVVIDRSISLGDGAPAAFLGGSVFMQNFGDNPGYDSYCQSGSFSSDCYRSQLMCWEITYGPYDCRSWVKPTSNWSNAVDMVLSLWPTAPLGQPYQSRQKPYVKLGDFSGMSRAAANL